MSEFLNKFAQLDPLAPEVIKLFLYLSAIYFSIRDDNRISSCLWISCSTNMHIKFYFMDYSWWNEIFSFYDNIFWNIIILDFLEGKLMV